MKIFAKKRIVILSLTILLGILSVVRIYYVNTVQYTKKINTYKKGEIFEYHGFQVEVIEADVYTASDLKNKYTDIPDDVIDENDIIVKVKIKNIKKGKNELGIGIFTMQDGLENGGGTNPYLYPYLNQGQSGTLVLERASEQTLTLAFPTERTKKDSDGNLKLILTLYPEKREIIL